MLSEVVVVVIMIILVATIYEYRCRHIAANMPKVLYDESQLRTGDLLITLYDNWVGPRWAAAHVPLDKIVKEYIVRNLLYTLSTGDYFTHIAMVVVWRGKRYAYMSMPDRAYDHYTGTYRSGNVLYKLDDYVHTYGGMIAVAPYNGPELDPDAIMGKYADYDYTDFATMTLNGVFGAPWPRRQGRMICTELVSNIIDDIRGSPRVPYRHHTMNISETFRYARQSGLYGRLRLIVNSYLTEQYLIKK